MPNMIEGGCLCGDVRYRCESEPQGTTVCHCDDCRRASGAPFASNIFVPRDAVTFQGKLTRFSSKASSGKQMHRSFCGRCGSLLMIEPEVTPGGCALTVGTVDDASWFEPHMEFWTARKHPWFEISCERTSFEENPPPPPSR